MKLGENIEKSSIFAAVGTAAIAVSGIAAVVMLAAIVSTTGTLLETAQGSDSADNVTESLPPSVTERFEGEVGERGQIDEVIAAHLDNAEREVMQGNNTAAILELVSAIRLVHGVTETALLDSPSNQTAPPLA